MLTPAEIKKLKGILGGRDEGLSAVFGALGDPKRCRIFRSFLKEKELCVSDIAEILGVSMPSASQHLKILTAGGLLAKKRQGKRIYYAPRRDNPIVGALIKAVG